MKKRLLFVMGAVLVGAAVLFSCQKTEMQEEALILKSASGPVSWNDPVCPNVEHTFCLTCQVGDNLQVQYEVTPDIWTPVFQKSKATSTSECFTYTFTIPGTYSWRYKIGSGGFTEFYVVVSEDATIALTSAEGTDAQTVCVNNAIEDIIYTIGGGATGALVNGLPEGVTGILADKTFTISGTPTVAGDYTYTVNTVGPCVTPFMTGTITVEECGCPESFSYVKNEDGTYTFTYVPAVDMEDAVLVFTFPQSALDGEPLTGWTYNGQTMQATMDLEACKQYSWTVSLTCKDLNNPQNKWTDFKVNNVSKKGGLANINCK